MHRISSRNSTLSIFIKIYLQSSLSASPNRHFYSWNITMNYCLICEINNFISKFARYIWYLWLVFLFSRMISIFGTTSFCGDFNSCSFSYSSVIILLINSWYFSFAPSLNLDTESHIGIVKQLIPQSNLFEQHDHTAVSSLLGFFYL